MYQSGQFWPLFATQKSTSKLCSKVHQRHQTRQNHGQYRLSRTDFEVLIKASDFLSLSEAQTAYDLEIPNFSPDKICFIADSSRFDNWWCFKKYIKTLYSQTLPILGFRIPSLSPPWKMGSSKSRYGSICLAFLSQRHHKLDKSMLSVPEIER